MQNHYNLIYREEEREMIPLCLDQGVGLIPWSPLARGFFAGNRQGEDEASATRRAQTDEFAQQMYFRDNDFKVAAAVQEVAPRTRRHAHPDRLRLDIAGAGGHRAHHRRHQAPSSQGELRPPLTSRSTPRK